jgi:hypothetical protein
MSTPINVIENFQSQTTKILYLLDHEEAKEAGLVEIHELEKLRNDVRNFREWRAYSCFKQIAVVGLRLELANENVTKQKNLRPIPSSGEAAKHYIEAYQKLIEEVLPSTMIGYSSRLSDCQGPESFGNGTVFECALSRCSSIPGSVEGASAEVPKPLLA